MSVVVTLPARVFAAPPAWELGGEDLLFIFGQRITDDRVVFLRAEDDTHRRVIPGIHQLTGVVIDIHLHLPQILMGQLPGFKVY